MKTLRQIYEEIYHENLKWYMEYAVPINMSEDRANRLSNILAVQRTVETWRKQYAIH